MKRAELKNMNVRTLLMGLALASLYQAPCRAFVVAPTARSTSSPCKALTAPQKIAQVCGQRRGGAGGCSMSAMHNALTLAAAAQAVVAMPHQAYSIYMGAMDANAVAVDMGTASLLYMLGKLTSKALMGESAQLKDDQAMFLARWGVLGLCDGLCTHHWYELLQSMVTVEMPSASLADKFTDGFVMAAVSSLVYTPVYSAVFLLLLTLLEGKSWQRAVERVRMDTQDLSLRTFKVWGPTNVMLFSLVPIQHRTAVSMLIHYVFLVGVALWDSSVRQQRGTSVAAGPEVAEVGSMREVLNLRAATCFVEPQLDLDKESPDLPGTEA